MVIAGNKSLETYGTSSKKKFLSKKFLNNKILLVTKIIYPQNPDWICVSSMATKFENIILALA